MHEHIGDHVWKVLLVHEAQENRGLIADRASRRDCGRYRWPIVVAFVLGFAYCDCSSLCFLPVSFARVF